MRVVRLAIVGTIVFWAIAYTPILIYSGDVNGVCTLTDDSYAKFTDLFLTPLVYAVGPLTLITLRATNFVYRHDRLAGQIRGMLVPQLAILAISGIPFGFQMIFD